MEKEPIELEKEGILHKNFGYRNETGKIMIAHHVGYSRDIAKANK